MSFINQNKRTYKLNYLITIYRLNSNVMLEDKLQMDPTINIDCEDHLFSVIPNKINKSNVKNTSLDEKNIQSTVLNNDIKKDALLLTKRKTK